MPQVKFHLALATPSGIFEYFYLPQHALCVTALAFLYASGTNRTLRVVTPLHESQFGVHKVQPFSRFKQCGTKLCYP